MPATKKAKAAVKPVTAVTIGEVTERAMLVTLRQSIWRANRVDDQVTSEVAKTHGNRRDMGAYKKFLVDPNRLAGGHEILRRARATHFRYTLPWLDGGQRVLPGASYFKYVQEMGVFQAQYKDWVENTFIANYDSYKDEAKQALSGLHKNEEYPTVAELRSKFDFVIIPDPMPDASDFRCKLGAGTEASVRNDISASVEQRLQGAVKDVWHRLKDVVEHMAKRLKAYEVEEVEVGGKKKQKVKNTFRDTLVSNITDLLEVVPVLNITNDPNLTEFCTTIREELTAATPDVLRDDEKKRKKVAKQADQILKKIGAFL